MAALWSDVHAAAAAMGVPRRPRSSFCTCDGYHTDAVSPSINNRSLGHLIDMETCPVERAVLVTHLVNRGVR